MSYKNRYIKYKTKYIQCKNKYNKIQIGGNKNLVIHIAGAQGSGKTTLGNKLKDKYDIYVKDLDDLQSEFHQQTETKAYQKFINNFIDNHNDKPLIITGLSAEKCLGNMNDDDNTFYIINTKYKYYIDIDDNKVLIQRFFRQISKLDERKESLFNDWLHDNEKIQEKLFRYINLNKWKTNNIACKEIHKKYNYKFMSGDEIFTSVCKLLDDTSIRK